MFIFLLCFDTTSQVNADFTIKGKIQKKKKKLKKVCSKNIFNLKHVSYDSTLLLYDLHLVNYITVNTNAKKTWSFSHIT